MTLSNAFRAKGNEAWKCYVCRFQYAIKPWGVGQHRTPIQAELEQRNQAFACLTRAKVWCVVSGQSSPVFEELAAFTRAYPRFEFPAFNRRSLHRIFDDELSVADADA